MSLRHRKSKAAEDFTGGLLMGFFTIILIVGVLIVDFIVSIFAGMKNETLSFGNSRKDGDK